ncbi:MULTISPECIES: protein-disulfide reductase DsbD [unclassified Pseudomonas]|uniref:protein-disulfide reductase DsbD n=1 Tax=unclassified Pseudomonas TaxID=196821 RepID=UPI000BC433A6|nr:MULTISPECIES: protein-disulfide reductase DsbD [unclassified Pseudomonas]PVZ09777.1 thiol:disulfide interchange protein DsbD [Pseudomonas sp. URIL14HWK12:I12]PVZ21467.1 thiol:disulfide interchange protein DsbD [Pseudomonas sp. URIL14HWK12:I10]PVZ30352.1 thiol:disulfide interchange protein DsbD [Pseudomonas sp. URIL14HWK12:I11]SNZ18649.1 thiol:disulfide interchange protein DsbD [Pseudomonas sp. URIL14HWK12:I9]
MRRFILFILLCLALPVAADVFGSRPNAGLGAPLDNSSDFLPVREAFQLSQADSPPEQITLRFVAAEGYYLYRQKFAFKAEPAAVVLGQPQFPEGEKKHDEYFGEVEVYHNIVDVTLPRPAAANGAFNLLVTYQGCADKGLCYPPETQRLAIAAVPGAAPPSSASSVAPAPSSTLSWAQIALYFLAGLGLTFTPCVLPMLPILSGVVLRGQAGGVRGFTLSLAYVLPMAACFAVLGALIGVFGASLNLQARLQSPWVLVPFALFFVVFALAMFGLFELRLPRFLSNRLDAVANRTQGGSILGAATLGVLSSLLVSPCVSAPLAGALLYISASGDALGGGLKLFALGLGMGLPLLVVGTGGAALLPRSGAWMNTVKAAVGVLLLGVAISLLERVLPGQVTLLLAGALAAGCGLFLGALEFVPKAPRQRLAQLLGLFLLCYGLVCWFGALRGEGNPLQPLPPVGSPAVAGPQAGAWRTLTTARALDDALAEARSAGKPVVLDWYADWCISCKVIEHQVLPDAQVQAKLTGFERLRFDVTESNAEQRAVMDRYGLFGPPAIQFFAASGDELRAARVVGEINAADLAGKIPDGAVQ